jgi:GcrA cell cycle regulator
MLDATITATSDSTPDPTRAPAQSPAHSPWTPERIEQLRNCVTSGLSCSQIAAEIGVTRNAVIGKIHRLGLSPGRPAAAPARSCPPRARPPRRQFLRVMFAQAPSLASDEAATVAIESTQRCSLTELAQGKCRWPIGDPCAADFAFCGNEAVAGFSYCSGHARMAYRVPARRRA